MHIQQHLQNRMGDEKGRPDTVTVAQILTQRSSQKYVPSIDVRSTKLNHQRVKNMSLFYKNKQQILY